MNTKKIITIVAVILISGLLIYGGILANQVFSKNTKFSENELYVQIPTGSTYEDVKKIIAPLVENMNRFEMVANKRSYPENVKSGRFLFTKGMNSYQLVKSLRSNVPVKLAFNNQERLEDFAGRVSSQIEPDSLLLLKTFKYLKDLLFLSETASSEAPDTPILFLLRSKTSRTLLAVHQPNMHNSLAILIDALKHLVTATIINSRHLSRVHQRHFVVDNNSQTS